MGLLNEAKLVLVVIIVTSIFSTVTYLGTLIMPLWMSSTLVLAFVIRGYAIAINDMGN